MAGKGGKRKTSWKKGESGNPKGSSATVRAAAHSLNWHVKQRFSDEDRAQAIDAQVIRARAGDEKSLELLAKLGGETHEPAAAPNVNILALIAGSPDGRELAQRVFTALTMGGGDAGGLGLVHEQGRRPGEAGLDAVEAPDADQ